MKLINYVKILLLLIVLAVSIHSAFTLSSSITSQCLIHILPGSTYGVYDSFNNLIYVLNSKCNLVYVISATNYSILGTIAVLGSPTYAVVDPSNGYIYVSDNSSCYVTVIQGTSIKYYIHVNPHPGFAVFDPSNDYIYVSTSKSLCIIQNLSVINSLSCIKNVVSMIYDPYNNYIYVNTIDVACNIIFIIHQASVICKLNVTYGMVCMTYDPSNHYIYITNWNNNEVYVLSCTTIIKEIQVSTGPTKILYDPYNNYIYVVSNPCKKINVIGKNCNIISNISVSNYICYLAYNPSNHFIYAVSTSGNVMYVIDCLNIIKYVSTGFCPKQALVDPKTGSVLIISYDCSFLHVIKYIGFLLKIVQSGLPSGTSWSVNINGTKYTTTSNVYCICLPIGIYCIRFCNVSGFKVNTTAKIVDLNTNVTLPISFSPVTVSSTFTIPIIPIIGGIVVGGGIAGVIMFQRSKKGRRKSEVSNSSQQVEEKITRIGKYELLEEIGVGSDSRVYKAKTSTGALYAVKILNNPSKEFLTKIVTWSKLEHPNIVKLIDYGISPRPYLVMELLKYPLSHKKFDKIKATKIMLGVLSALKYAHANGVIHGDLRPSNILLDENDNPKISDWGIEDIYRETSDPNIVRYETPEYFKKDKIDEKSDIYQFCEVYYEILTGRPAFSGTINEITSKKLNEDFVLPSKIDNNLKELDEFFRACFSVDKNKRYNEDDIEKILNKIVNENSNSLL